ncbi:hypothetical protein EB001_05890 [bacterium]|nr:hypothetical protein [bacterium]
MMPKYRVTEVIKLPIGTPRFQETIPALVTAYQTNVDAGKVTRVPSTWVDADGYRTTTTSSIWNRLDEYETFKTFVLDNYTCLQAEYYYSITSHPDHRDNNLTKTTTVTEEN